MHPAVQAYRKDISVVCAEEMERQLGAAWDLIGGETVSSGSWHSLSSGLWRSLWTDTDQNNVRRL
jgi:hypothetical protein